MAKRRSETGFRWILLLGALVSIVLAVWGLIWTSMLASSLGLEIPRRSLGLARLYGGTMLAIGIGYALAAAQPQRNRSLLVPLFVVPLATAAAAIAGIARGEIAGARGGIFVAYNLAYALLYFRLYPRVEEPSESQPEPPQAPSQD